jgi:hypothetical protein
MLNLLIQQHQGQRAASRFARKLLKGLPYSRLCDVA